MTDELAESRPREQLLVQQLPSDGRAAWRVSTYDANTISRITDDAPENGYTFLLIPAFSDAHLAYGKDAPGFKDLYQHPIIGWITGVHLDDLATKEPKVFNGIVGEVHSDLALACHVPLPADKMAFVDIVNIFARSAGPDMRFATDGFTVTDCSIGGETTNFARWLAQKRWTLGSRWLPTITARSSTSASGKSTQTRARLPSARRCSGTECTGWPNRCRTTCRLSSLPLWAW